MTIAALDLATRLQEPEFRKAAIRVGYVPGTQIEPDTLAADLAASGYHLAADTAREAHVQGWNLRCNRCGTFGATWTDGTERPGWGSLALCGPHKQELAEENRRHAATLRTVRHVAYEQPTREPRPISADDYM